MKNVSEKDFFPQPFLKGSHKIFLLGSSHVADLNATFIENSLTKYNEFYDVYNLGKVNDRPSERLESLDDILSVKPDIVAYGVEFRDFQRLDLLNTTLSNDFFSTQMPLSILPNPHNQLEKLLPFSKFFQYDFYSFRNPQLLTLQTIDVILGGKHFPVSDDILKTVWEDRPDLQKAFPEVKQQNLDNLRKWAATYGWDEDNRLYALTPSQKIPKYMAVTNVDVPINDEYKLHTPFYKHYDAEFYPISKVQLEDFVKKHPFTGFDSISKERNVEALKNIIYQLQKNNIKVIIFTTPVSKFYLDTVPLSDKQTFDSIMKDIEKEFNMEVYYLHDKYTEQDIWFDPSHVALYKSEKYNDDVIKIILKRIGQ